MALNHHLWCNGRRQSQRRRQQRLNHRPQQPTHQANVELYRTNLEVKPNIHKAREIKTPDRKMGDRKARLAALAARAGRTKAEESSPQPEDGDGDGGEPDETQTVKPIVFRNYTPKDSSLLQRQQGEDNDDDETQAPLPPGGGGQSSSSPSNKRPRPNDATPSNGDSSSGGRQQPSNTTAPKKPMTLSESLARAKQEIAHQMSNGSGGGSGSLDPFAAGSGGDVSALAPEKINGDLKRGIQDKLSKLERRTQKAIVELLKERLAQEAAEGGDDDDEEEENENDLD